MSPDPQLFKPTMGNICVLDPNQLLLITTVIFNNSGHIVHICCSFLSAQINDRVQILQICQQNIQKTLFAWEIWTEDCSVLKLQVQLHVFLLKNISTMAFNSYFSYTFFVLCYSLPVAINILVSRYICIVYLVLISCCTPFDIYELM